jgi:hypothetical protein
MIRPTAMRGLMPFLSARFLGRGFGIPPRKRRRLPLARPLRCGQLLFQILHGGFQVSQPLLQLGVLSPQLLVFSATWIMIAVYRLSCVLAIALFHR